MTREWVRFPMLVAVLGAIAPLAPQPSHPTDLEVYERMSQSWFVATCDDIHCFRVLVPWIIGAIPGPALLKWKAAAVVCEAGAAWLMRRWVLVLGASPEAATQVMWLTAFGAGSLYTLFDPHTSDPLMHLLGPGLMLLLIRSRIAIATATACLGVLAKEFAVVPLFVAGLTWLQQRRFGEMWRAWFGGLLAVAFWLGWQTLLRRVQGYDDGGNRSFDLLSGAYFFYWVRWLHPTLVVTSLVMALGVLWILWIAGVYWRRREVAQLSLAALPCILGLCYVQQPDRALWNFAFVVMPAAAVVLSRSSAMLGWGIVAAHAMVNMRVGAQLPYLPPARYSLVVGVALTIAAVWQSATVEQRRLSPA